MIIVECDVSIGLNDNIYCIYCAVVLRGRHDSEKEQSSSSFEMKIKINLYITCSSHFRRASYKTLKMFAVKIQISKS